MKQGIKIACLSLCAALALAGCASDHSQRQYSFNYDPYDPDKLAHTLPLDTLFPSGPLPTLPDYAYQQSR